MKNVKVSDAVHERLLELSRPTGKTVSDVIKDHLSGSVTSSDSLSRMADQLEMLFKAVDGLNIAADNVLDGIEESCSDKEARLKLEQIARLKAQKHAIDHPEDSDQTGGW